MPTMISKKLGDLESERESFLLHERRIILERDEILKSLRSHLDQLDAEIVRLGGTARDAVEKNVEVIKGGDFDDAVSADDHAGALLLALADGGGFVPSVAPFHSVNSAQKKSNDGIQKKGRGRPRKESVAEKENASSNNASTPNGEGAKSSEESSNLKKIGRASKDDGAPTSMNESSLDSVRVGTDANFEKKPLENETKNKTTPKKKKRRKKPPLASPAADDHTGEAWICECGENMAAGRARCGKCRRWKGGKRQKRWSMKDRRDSSAANAGKKNVAKSAIDAYRNLRTPVELESATDGAAVILANLAAIEDPLSEVETIVGQMVSAVSSILDPSRPKKTRGPAKKKVETTESTLEKGEQTVTKKRKRGRPKKDSDKAQEQQSIQRVVSTSDSDSGSATEAPRKRGRPRKNLVADGTVVERQAEKARSADGGAVQAPKESHLGADDAKTVPAAAVAEAPVPPYEQSDERERIASDCLEYFDRVKQTALADSPRTHDDLVKVVAEFKSRKVDTVGLICRVMTLLDRRDDLILGINAFLPDGYKIDVKDLKKSAPR